MSFSDMRIPAEGFPGALDVTVTYTVTPDAVRIDDTAASGADTVVSLTNHTSLNLDGEASGPVDAHRITLSAGAFTPVDEQLAHGQGLDHNLVVDGAGMRHVATLRGSSGCTVEVTSGQPGVQVYTGAHFDGTVIGTSGTAYGPRAGVALETQGLPDGPSPRELPVGATAPR